MLGDYDSYCDLVEGDPYADERAEEAELDECDLASIEEQMASQTPAEKMLDAVGDVVYDALPPFEALPFGMRGKLASVLWAYSNSRLILEEAISEKRAAAPSCCDCGEPRKFDVTAWDYRECTCTDYPLRGIR